jgi:hypothetical protein
MADGLAGIARLGGGALADDPARRRATAVGGYTSVAILSGLIGAATSLWQVAVFRTSAWAARGLRVPSRNALLADATPPEAYGRAYGFERAPVVKCSISDGPSGLRGVPRSRITVCSVAVSTSAVSAIAARSMPILSGILNP